VATPKKGTYYLGRVIKLGQLDDDRLVRSILEPREVIRRKSAWTFIDALEVNEPGQRFVFARLSKYSPKAEVKVVDPKRRSEIKRGEPNLVSQAVPSSTCRNSQG
jgi:hypothetical protein